MQASAHTRRSAVNKPHPRAARAAAPRPATTAALRARHHVAPRAALDLSALSELPRETLAAAGAAVVALLGGIAAAIQSQNQMAAGDAPAPGASAAGEAAAPPPLPRENAVLVLGATGRSGRMIVQEVRRGAGPGRCARRAAPRLEKRQGYGSPRRPPRLSGGD